MAVENYPWAIQAEPYSAEITRRGIYVSLMRNPTNGTGTVSGGIIGAGDLLLSAPGSGLSVNVAAGECIIPGSALFGSTVSGYYLRNTASLNLAIATASPSNPRIDLVCATINDATYHGSTNSGVIQVITGTPTTGVTLTNLTGAAALPDASLLIGYVLVPTSATSIISGDILNPSTASGATKNTLTLGIPLLAVTYQTSNYQALPGDLVIVPSGSPTITAPATHRKGQPFAVVNHGTGTVTVSASSGAIFGTGLGSAGASSIVLSAYGSSAEFADDGTNLNILASKQDTDWIGAGAALTYESSWVDQSGAVLQYRLEGNQVLWQGGITAGGLNASVFNLALPAIIRPLNNKTFFCPGYSSGNLSFVTISTAGQVEVVASSVATSDGVCFDAITYTND